MTQKSLLADAEFELQDKDGNTLKTNLKTDQKGKLTVADLLPGEYQFVETKAPTGYILDTTPLKFKISTEALKRNCNKKKIRKNQKYQKCQYHQKTRKPDKIISEDSKQTALPKTGDSPLVNGWGLLLVAISASGLIALRRK